MADEYLDIVDDNDEVIGRELRSVAHEKRLLHRFANIFLINKDGELLVCQRAFTKQHGPGTSSVSAGGHVKSGSTYKETVLEELYEEIGVKMTPEQVTEIGSLKEDCIDDYQIGKLFVAHYDGGYILDTSEVRDAHRMKISELENAYRAMPRMFLETIDDNVQLVKKYM